MNTLDFFKARLEATVSPMDVQKMLAADPGNICIVDVRNGSASLLEKKIKGAIEIPQAQLEKRYAELPKDKLIIVYCWDTWCSLAAKAAVFLLEKGFKVKELYGGTMAWNALKLPTQPVHGFTGKRENNSPNKLIR